MWAFLVGLFPFIQQIINWWNGVEAEKTAAANAEQAAEIDHQNDGAQSVADQDSGEAQNAALDDLQKQLETAQPIVIKEQGK